MGKPQRRGQSLETAFGSIISDQDFSEHVAHETVSRSETSE
jgi:hypothetical protein